MNKRILFNWEQRRLYYNLPLLLIVIIYLFIIKREPAQSSAFQITYDLLVIFVIMNILYLIGPLTEIILVKIGLLIPWLFDILFYVGLLLSISFIIVYIQLILTTF